MWGKHFKMIVIVLFYYSNLHKTSIKNTINPTNYIKQTLIMCYTLQLSVFLIIFNLLKTKQL